MELRYAGTFDGEAKGNKETGNEASRKKEHFKRDSEKAGCKKSDRKKEVISLSILRLPACIVASGDFF